MKLLRVRCADETVSIGAVASFAFGNSITPCNPTRVSCVAALGCNDAGEMMFCSGELLFFVGSCDWSTGFATLGSIFPRLRDCASANGIAQIARSESRISALRRRCALMEGLICFFTSRVRCTHHRRNTLLPRNAKFRQAFLKTLEIFLGRWPRWFVSIKLKLKGVHRGECPTATLPAAIGLNANLTSSSANFASPFSCRSRTALCASICL